MNVNQFVNMAAGGIFGDPIRESTPWNDAQKRDTMDANLSHPSVERDPKSNKHAAELHGSYMDIIRGNLGNNVTGQVPNISRIPPVHLQTMQQATTHVPMPGMSQLCEAQYSIQGATLGNLGNTMIQQQQQLLPRINLIPNYKPPQPVYLKPGDLPNFYFDPFPTDHEETLTDPLNSSPTFQAMKHYFKTELTAQLTKAMGLYMTSFTS